MPSGSRQRQTRARLHRKGAGERSNTRRAVELGSAPACQRRQDPRLHEDVLGQKDSGVDRVARRSFEDFHPTEWPLQSGRLWLQWLCRLHVVDRGHTRHGMDRYAPTIHTIPKIASGEYYQFLQKEYSKRPKNCPLFSINVSSVFTIGIRRCLAPPLCNPPDISWAYLVVWQSGLFLVRSATWTTQAARGSLTSPSTPPNTAESLTNTIPKRASEEYYPFLQKEYSKKPKKIVSYSVLMF